MSKSAPDTSALPADATPRPEDEVEMGFFAHLNELRKRIIRALLGVIPAMFVTWAFKENILEEHHTLNVGQQVDLAPVELDTTHMYTFTVQVNDGVLDLDFIKGLADNPIANAIEVVATTAPE